MNMTEMIRLEDYVSEYYGKAKVLTICDVSFYFSYNTCIGTRVGAEKPYVTSEPISPTTAKHKTHIPHSQANRVGPDTFKAIVQANLIEAMRRLQTARREDDHTR